MSAHLLLCHLGHGGAKEKPQQDGRRGKSMFRIKPHTHCRDAQRTQTKPCAHQDPETTETKPHLPLSVWVSPAEEQVSSGLPQGQGLWVHQTWVTQHVAYNLLEEITSNPAIEPLSRWHTNCRTIIPNKFYTVKKVLWPTTDFPTWRSDKGTENPQAIWLLRPVGIDYRTYTGLGKQTLGGHKQNLVHTRRKQQWPHKRLTQTFLWAGVSAEVWVRGGCCRVGVTEGGSVCMDLLREVTIIFFTSSLVSGQTTGREHSPTHQ